MASILLGSVVLGGCNRSSEPVEHYIGVTDSGYVDSIKLSGVKRNNYIGYFLGDGISVETALELSNENLNNLCYGWNWELSDKKYNGDKIKLEEGESEKLWGVEKEVENGNEGSGEESEMVLEEDDKEGNEDKQEESNEGKPEENSEEVETEIVVETSGTVEKLANITGKELTLKSGQVLTVVPNYIEPIVEEEELNGDTEGTGEEHVDNEIEISEEVVQEETEPLAETLKSIVVTNYSKEDKTIKSCVESGWYTVQLNNYIECFGMKPLENEEEIPKDEVFSRLSESLGNPTIIWEQPTDDANYVNGTIQMIYAYEFPEYTILSGVVKDTINSMYYIPKSLWLQSDEYAGMKALYSASYIEIDKSELPEVEEVE